MKDLTITNSVSVYRSSTYQMEYNEEILGPEVPYLSAIAPSHLPLPLPLLPLPLLGFSPSPLNPSPLPLPLPLLPLPLLRFVLHRLSTPPLCLCLCLFSDSFSIASIASIASQPLPSASFAFASSPIPSPSPLISIHSSESSDLHPLLRILRFHCNSSSPSKRRDRGRSKNGIEGKRPSESIFVLRQQQG
ncbi:hypothetical protein SLEP1_g10484 [Rubroshorea leprosula]|uniref:Uncharacterized protein n=1 Tax=Rubroshorea leprosula TaxID=152421 RepID=A0AAV5IHN3_9ROSI|nr:hypothetical protein SLEP1_g10484 [Rubroshorea leprosula]